MTTPATTLETMRTERDADGVVTLTLDDTTQRANTMRAQFVDDLATIVDELRDDEELTGVIVTSAKSTFFAGGDLNELIAAGPDDAQAVYDNSMRVKLQLRALETLGKPVVAALNGTALGGGLEIALACHRRIALEDPKAVFGLPEVTLGLLPGGGGVVRTVRMLGIINALISVLTQGQRHKLAKAVELGLVDEVAADHDAMIAAARAWIADNPDAAQPWDRDGYRMPGGDPSRPSFAANAPAIPANLKKQTKGADYHAPRNIMCAAYEGAQVDIDTAFRIEARYFTDLVCNSPQSTNMTQAFFFDLQAIEKGSSRPDGYEPFQATKVAVLGAGMMGAGIAYQCAKSGIEVVLKDVSLDNATKGKGYAEKLVAKGVERGKVSEEKGQALLDRITPTDDDADLAGCDLVIEAVFESTELKHQVFADTEPVVNDDALLCSNTSTLPITTLAEGVSRPEDFIGLHFFSPVDKMPLVEIIRGERTSDAALAKAFDVVQQIRKTPIVVNDSRGFFTSRVIGTFLNEAIAALGEGVDPVRIERAGEQAGYPAPPLQLMDELTLTLPRKIEAETAKAAGDDYERHPAFEVVDRMVDEFGREGRSGGAGFYEYGEDGKRTGLWPGLREHFARGVDVPVTDLIERMLFAEAIETVKCFDEGVIETFPDANIGSIFGIGFPAWTGGVAQYIDQYPGGTTGFVTRCKELTDAYGERFTPPASLVAKAESGEPLRPRG
ncbi:MAG: enoyl-CoA hydratase/isomerase family protein [Nitriliruptoraceae bacterium]|nr:enoyl-CoA hydratase/isomerase family protein [Nitriliruptoraceae bacterium]